MKTTLLVLLSLGILAHGQQQVLRPPQRIINPVGPQNNSAASPLAKNYILGLTLLDRKQVATELSLVVASTAFNATFLDVNGSMVVFSGTINPEEDGSVLIAYSLATEIGVAVEGSGTQMKSFTITSSARVRPAVPIQIVQSPAFSSRFTLTALPETAPDAK
ncbi:MAG TPA: hypothetical protein VGO90_07230 [Chthoniobacteraceae bacterium]|nr:hypothetical protein [Chthoniobacteraceae bacterium]